MPQPVCPWPNSQMRGGNPDHRRADRQDRDHAGQQPDSTGCGTPASHSPKAVITPCTTAVPSSP